MENVKISISSDRDIPAYISLLEDVGEWLWNKGVKQWEPGIHRREYQTISSLIENGFLVLGHYGELLGGGCVLSYKGPDFWPNDPVSIYLYRLVVARFAAGKGLGRDIIQYCEKLGVEKGLKSIRLDCWDGNDFLKSFYQEIGFQTPKSKTFHNSCK